MIEGDGELIGAVVQFAGGRFESYCYRNGARLIGESTAPEIALAKFWGAP